MPAAKSKIHKLTVTVKTDARLSRSQAAYALWNAVHGLAIYGNGKRECDHVGNSEPYDRGTITVPRRQR